MSRKATLQTDETQEQTTEQEQPEVVKHTLDIEEPDDIASQEQEEKGLFDKAVHQLKDFFKYEDSKAKTPKRKFFQRKVAWLSKRMVYLMNSMYPAWWQEVYEVAGEEKSIAPSQADYEKCLHPFARVADRHVDVKIDNPDWEDIGEGVINIFMLIWQMRANHKLLTMLLEAEERRNHGYSQEGANASSLNGQVVILDNLI